VCVTRRFCIRLCSVLPAVESRDSEISPRRSSCAEFAGDSVHRHGHGAYQFDSDGAGIRGRCDEGPLVSGCDRGWDAIDGRGQGDENGRLVEEMGCFECYPELHSAAGGRLRLVRNRTKLITHSMLVDAVVMDASNGHHGQKLFGIGNGQKSQLI